MINDASYDGTMGHPFSPSDETRQHKRFETMATSKTSLKAEPPLPARWSAPTRTMLCSTRRRNDLRPLTTLIFIALTIGITIFSSIAISAPDRPGASTATTPPEAESASESLERLRQLADVFIVEALAAEQNGPVTDGLSSDEVRITIQNPDSRLRLARCEHEPEASFGPGAGPANVNTTVEIRCNQPSWRIYLGARVERTAKVAIVTRNLARNHVLSASDVRFESRSIGAQAYVTNRDAVIGQSTRRALRAGQPLLAHQITSPTRVRRGERVHIVSQNPRIQIQMVGEALEDGKIGDTVRVRNLSSSREITARVREDGRVEVLL